MSIKIANDYLHLNGSPATDHTFYLLRIYHTYNLVQRIKNIFAITKIAFTVQNKKDEDILSIFNF